MRNSQFKTMQRAMKFLAICFALLIFLVVSVLTITNTTLSTKSTSIQADTSATYTHSIIGIISTSMDTARLCLPLLGPCSTPTPTPEPTQAPTPTPKPTQAPTPKPTQASTPQPTQAPAPTRAPQPTATSASGAATPTAAAGANPPVQSPTPAPSQSITPTVTAGAQAPVATATSTTATSNTKTADQSKNKNSLSGMLLPVGGVSVMILAIAGVLGVLLFRRRQLQKSAALASQASKPAYSWANHNQVNAASELLVMGAPEYPAENTVLAPNAIPPAMQEFIQPQSPASTSIVEADVENHATIAQPSPFAPDALLTQQTPFAESELSPLTPPVLQTNVPEQDAASADLPLPAEDPEAPPALTPSGTLLYAAPDMQPLAMNLPENVVTDLERKKTDVLPPQQQGLQDDPFLEAMMRQAQMGLFALPDKEPAESTPGGDSSHQE